MRKYLALDIETGGLEDKHSLLTAAFIVFTEDGEVLDQLSFGLRHDTYIVTAEALEVNGICLKEHNKTAIELLKAQNLLKQFLRKNSHSGAPEGSEKPYIVNHLIPVGSQIEGDIRKIKSQLVQESFNWETFVSYRYINLVSVASALRDGGILNIEKLGLEKLANLYNIKYTPHNALEDARASMEVYLSMVGSLK